ncbi:MAG: hypothetical protein ABSD72_09310 [Terracidiphilus sp.]|jgi:hypothetical protein
MKNLRMAIWMVAGGLLVAAPAFAQGDKTMGQGRAVVTILPKGHGEMPASISQQDLNIKVNGKPSMVTSWKPLRGPDGRLELVILIDGSARSSLGNQFQDIQEFVNSLPPDTKAGIAYMINGRAAFVGPLSADHARVLQALHLPGGPIGTSGSPYFCLSDLAQHWPSGDRGARRAVVMVTDGIDNYNRRFDPEDPYVQAAITDSVRAGLVVYSIYYQVMGRGDRSLYANNTGQSLLLMVEEATGGESLWPGIGEPVSFKPFFEQLNRDLGNQYELGFSAPLNGKPTVETLKVKVGAQAVSVSAPQQVFVDRVTGGE